MNTPESRSIGTVMASTVYAAASNAVGAESHRIFLKSITLNVRPPRPLMAPHEFSNRGVTVRPDTRWVGIGWRCILGVNGSSGGSAGERCSNPPSNFRRWQEQQLRLAGLQYGGNRV